MKWFWGTLYVLFCTLCLAVGAGARLVGNIAETVAPGESVVKVLTTMKDPRSEFPGQNSLVLLLVGQDYNRDKKGMPYTKNSRADTIMLLRADLENKSVQACSIPRDSYVTALDQVSGKINGTLPRGGIELLKGTLEQMFGIHIDNYVIIKPYAVRKIVDAIGGVTVEAIDDMNYDDNWGQLHVHMAAGQHHVDGEGAEGFVRFREVKPGTPHSKEEGDLRRTARQQQLIHSLMVAAKSSGNIMRADEIMETGFEQIETDLPRLKVFALANIFKDAQGKPMKSATVPGEDEKRDGVYYYQLDLARAQAMVDWLIKGDDLAMKHLVRVEIRNGTKTKGLARLAADMLSAQGYTASAPGNAPSTAETTIVYRKASFEDAAREIQKTLGAASVTKEAKPANEWEPEIRIVIGEDLKTKLQPTPSTSQ